MARYTEIREGDTFTVSGRMYLFIAIEKDTIVLRDVKTGRRIIHGLEAFRRLAQCYGLKVVEG